MKCEPRGELTLVLAAVEREDADTDDAEVDAARLAEECPDDEALIVEGMVEVSRAEGARPLVPLITYGPGDVLGQGVILDDAEHSTTAVAKTPVLSWGAPGEALRKLLDSDPALKAHVYGRLIRRLAERLQVTMQLQRL